MADRFHVSETSHVYATKNDVDLLSESITDDAKLQAERFKEKANEFFKNEKYNEAIEHYTHAIDSNPCIAAYYGNRSFAYIRTECFGYALADANKALQVDRNYVKAYYRRASANMALGKFKQALKDFETVAKVKPNDKDARTKYNECNKIIKRIAFEKAIAVDDSCTLDINIQNMVIEDDYSGPKMNEDKVSVEFMNNLMDTFNKQGKLHRKFAYQILLDVKEIFMAQESLVDIVIPASSKFTVCGDIHGQYYDLMNIFKLNGQPSQQNPYLFNGDFVDRGSFSVECIFVLFGFKLLYPNHFFMSRGNHESSTMNQMYGFEGELKSKYNSQMVKLFTEVFNWLPLAHTLNSKVFVTHGGLFSDPDVTLADVRKISRNRQPPESGLMCELLWSDPQTQAGQSESKRGVGIQFGPDITANFLKTNDLNYVIRSHEVKSDGYEVSHDGKCITVFSAPNYCDTMGNKGAYITMDGADLIPKYTTYDAVPHPSVRPMAYASPLFGLF